ncbi:MAG: hypothetical protein ACI8PP_001127 [Candidatus Pseudothioglobus sp.]|jgi:hypothetical protein
MSDDVFRTVPSGLGEKVGIAILPMGVQVLWPAKALLDMTSKRIAVAIFHK